MFLSCKRLHHCSWTDQSWFDVYFAHSTHNSSFCRILSFIHHISVWGKLYQILIRVSSFPHTCNLSSNCFWSCHHFAHTHFRGFQLMRTKEMERKTFYVICCTQQRNSKCNLPNTVSVCAWHFFGAKWDPETDWMCDGNFYRSSCNRHICEPKIDAAAEMTGKGDVIIIICCIPRIPGQESLLGQYCSEPYGVSCTLLQFLHLLRLFWFRSLSGRRIHRCRRGMKFLWEKVSECAMIFLF